MFNLWRLLQGQTSSTASPKSGITNFMHQLVLAEQLQNAFVVPVAQDGFHLSTVDHIKTPMIRWTSNFTAMTLSLWQDSNDAFEYSGLKYTETELFYNTDTLYLDYPWESLFDVESLPISSWYLSIKDKSGSGESFNSTYFNINNIDDHSETLNQELKKRAKLSNTFINPPPTDLNDPIAKDYVENPNYAVGTPFEISWTTNMTSYGLAYWQDLPCKPACSNGPIWFEDTLTADSPQNLSWTVSPETYNISESVVFWFGLYEIADGSYSDASPIQHSHYFNITGAAVDDTTTSSSSSSITSAKSAASTAASSQATSVISISGSHSATTTTTTTTTTTGGPAAQSTNTAASSTSPSVSAESGITTIPNGASKTSKSSSLSSGAKIGIAIGVIALVFIIGFAGYLLYKYGQRKGNSALSNGSPSSSTFPTTTDNTMNNTTMQQSPSGANSISGGFFAPRADAQSFRSGSDYSDGHVQRQADVGEMDAGMRRNYLPPVRGELSGDAPSRRQELAGDEPWKVYELPESRDGNRVA